MMLKQYLKNNKPLKVKRGSFTTCYVFDNNVLLKSRDVVKECIANGWFPDSEHLPEIARCNLEADDSYNTRCYESPRYVTNRSVKSIVCEKDYHEIYLPLVKMFKDAPWHGLSHGERQIEFHTAIDCSTVRDDIKGIIKDCYDALLSYDHCVGFEISPRNVAATQPGTLILLDCFYIVTHLH